MCRFIETLKVVDGQIQNITYHDKRVKESSLFFHNKAISIYDLLTDFNNAKKEKGIFKLRIVYDTKLLDYSLEKYSKKKIEKLKIIRTEPITYNFKFEDRTIFKNLTSKCSDNEEMIISVNGKITDSSYSNLIFQKNNKWFTPKDCLLPGTKRAFLLDKKIITEEEVTEKNIFQYENVSLINAMLEPGDIFLPIDLVIQ